MKSGYGRIDITPPIGLEMCGYGMYLERMAEGTLDPLYARCVVIDSGDRRAILLSLDLVALDVYTGLAVRDRLAAQFGTTADLVMIAGTHTHSGPCTWTLRGWGAPDAAYNASLPDLFAQAVHLAIDDLAPSTIAAGAAPVEPIGFNRVGIKTEDIDREVRTVRLIRDNGDIVIANHSCHAVTLGVNKEWSADYPGGVCRYLDGQEAHGVFFNGCCGDIDPIINQVKWGSGTMATVEEYGRTIGAVALAIGEGEAPAEPIALRGASMLIDLPLVPTPRAEVEAALATSSAAYAKDPKDSGARFEEDWATECLTTIDAGRAPTSTPFPIQAIDLGPAILVSLGGEIFFDVAKQIWAAYPGKLILPIGYGTGAVGYIPGPEDFEKGGYAAAFVPKIKGIFPFTPDVASRVAQGAIKTIAQAVG